MRRWGVLALIVVALTATACSAGDMSDVGDQQVGDQQVSGGTAADAAGPMERDGTLDIEAARNTFSRTYGRAVEVAERFGADVLDATTDQQANGLPTGSLTLLVPDDSYTAVLTEMSGLGQVRSQHIQAVRRPETFDEATPPLEGSPEPTQTYSRLVVTISEPRSLANIAQTTWGIARQVMLYSAQAVMLLAVFAIPLVLAVGLLRMGIWGWRRLFNGSLARRPTPTPAADEAERQPSDIGA